MKRYAWLAGTIALLSVTLTTPTLAQTPSFFLGGGVTVPSGEYNDYAQTGWLGNAGILFDIGEQGLWIAGEAMYGHNSHDDGTGDATNLYGAGGNIGYRFGDPTKIGPYIYGSAGLLVHHYSPGEAGIPSESENKLAYGGGAGFDIPMGGATVWIEGRYIGTGSTNILPLMVGITFSPGGSRQ